MPVEVSTETISTIN